MPPGIPPPSSGASATTASVVRNKAAIEPAFCRAERVTLAASMMPASTRRQRIVRGDQLIASQDLRAGMLTVEGKPTRFPEEMVAALQRYVVTPD